MNIDGLGTKQIELFLELGWITDFASVFDLAKYRENFFENIKELIDAKVLAQSEEKEPSAVTAPKPQPRRHMESLPRSYLAFIGQGLPLKNKDITISFWFNVPGNLFLF